MDTSEPSLKDIIRRVSNELLESQEERRQFGEAAVFEVASLDIELNFVVTESKSGNLGMDLKVVSAGGNRHYEEQQVQRLVLHLTAPKHQDNADQTYPFYDDKAMPVRPRRASINPERHHPAENPAGIDEK
ncbi:trypco2 family protein [Kocuria rosea]|uniref:trypco2 family protein n=1 Tax=Kocuria rosea TaxID=1275 RepID=UPI000F817EFF|nr:trypco2 family protein [Kocuria rosea]